MSLMNRLEFRSVLVAVPTVPQEPPADPLDIWKKSPEYKRYCDMERELQREALSKEVVNSHIFDLSQDDDL